MNKSILMTMMVSIFSMASAHAMEGRALLFGPSEKVISGGAASVDGRVLLFTGGNVDDDRAAKTKNSKRPSSSKIDQEDGARRMLFAATSPATQADALVASPLEVSKSRVTENRRGRNTVAGAKESSSSKRRLIFSSAPSHVKLGVASAKAHHEVTNAEREAGGGKRVALFGPKANDGGGGSVTPRQDARAKSNVDVSHGAKVVKSAKFAESAPVIKAAEVLVAAKAPASSKSQLAISVISRDVEQAALVNRSRRIAALDDASPGYDIYEQRRFMTKGFRNGLVIGIFAESTSNKLSSDVNFFPLMNLLSQKNGLAVSPSYGFSRFVFKQQILENKYAVIYVSKDLHAAAAYAGFVPFAKIDIPKTGGEAQKIGTESYTWWAYKEAIDPALMRSLALSISTVGDATSNLEKAAIRGHHKAIGEPGVFRAMSSAEIESLLTEVKNKEDFRPGVDFDESIRSQNKAKSAIYTLNKR